LLPIHLFSLIRPFTTSICLFMQQIPFFSLHQRCFFPVERFLFFFSLELDLCLSFRLFLAPNTHRMNFLPDFFEVFFLPLAPHFIVCSSGSPFLRYDSSFLRVRARPPRLANTSFPSIASSAVSSLSRSLRTLLRWGPPSCRLDQVDNPLEPPFPAMITHPPLWTGGDF